MMEDGCFVCFLFVVALLPGCCSVEVISTKGASLPKTLYQRSLFTYSFVNSSPLSITYTGTGSGKGKAALKAGEAEFGGSDSLFKRADYEAVPDLQMYPTAAAAVVPIYNLPEIGHLPGPLVLGRVTLAQIFLGNITVWNDRRILADNSALLTQGAVFPAVSIRLFVRSGKSGTTEIFKKSLASFSAEFAAAGDTSSHPTWPTEVAVTRVSSSLLGPAVAMTPHSLGYSVLDNAIQRKLRTVHLINRAGRVVAASSGSIGAALEELGGSFDARFNAAIFDSGAAGAWPIAGYTYLILRRNTTISNCATRRAALRFWEWFYSDPTPSRLALRLGFATLPCAVSEQVLAHMRQHTLCGSPPQRVFSALAVTGRGAAAAVPLLRTLATAYAATNPRLALAFHADARSADALTREVARAGNNGDDSAPAVGEEGSSAAAAATTTTTTTGTSTQFAVVSSPPLQQLDSSSGGSGRSSITVPLAGSAVAIAYHGIAAAAGGDDSAPPPPLVLDVPLVGDILSGRVASWDHPRLAALNPGLALPPSPIVLVTCSAAAGGDSAALTLTASLRRLLGSASPLPVSSSTDGWGGGGSDHGSSGGTQAQAQTRRRVVSSYEDMVSAVAFLPHTLAVLSTMRAAAAGGGAGTMLLAHLQLSSPATATTTAAATSVVVAPTVPSVAACVAAPSAPSALATLDHAATEASAAAAGCWPFTSMLSLVFPASYTSAATSATSSVPSVSASASATATAAADSVSQPAPPHCPVAVATQRYLRWLFQGSREVDALLTTMAVAPLPGSHLRAVRAIQDRLTCDGQALLVKPACTAEDMRATVGSCDASHLTHAILYHFLVPDALERGCTGTLPAPTTVACASVLWRSPAATTAIALTAALLACCFLLMLFVVLNSRHKAIAYSQPRFCLLVILGAALTALSVLPFLGPNTHASCTLRAWGTPISFTVMFGNLLLKIHRAYRLLTNDQLRSFTIKAAVLYSRLAALLAVDVLLLALRQLLSPPAAVQTPLPLPPSVAAAVGGEPVMVAVCGADTSGMTTAIIAYKALLLLLGIALAVRAWGLQSSMAESKHLAVAIYNTAFVAAMVLLLSRGGFSLPTPVLVQLQCGAVLWCVFVTLAVVFLPKLREVGLHSRVVTAVGQRSRFSSGGGRRWRRSHGASRNGSRVMVRSRSHRHPHSRVLRNSSNPNSLSNAHAAATVGGGGGDTRSRQHSSPGVVGMAGGTAAAASPSPTFVATPGSPLRVSSFRPQPSIGELPAFPSTPAGNPGVVGDSGEGAAATAAAPAVARGGPWVAARVGAGVTPSPPAAASAVVAAAGGSREGDGRPSPKRSATAWP